MPLFANSLDPSSIDGLISILAAERKVRFWRGVPDESWRLDSTLLRRLVSRGHGRTDRSIRFWEEDLLARARHRGFDNVSGTRLSDFELLALLRHNGAATRLIDFTRSAPVALWFAARERPQTTGLMIGVHTDYIAGYGEGGPIPESYEDVLEQLGTSDDPWTWEPSGVSPRVAAQHSQFLFSRTTDESYGSLCLPVDTPDGILVIRIPPDLKAQAVPFLRSSLDIGAQTMFPDIAGFAQAFSVQPAEAEYRW